MPLSAPVDGFRLAYDRHGSGRAVVLLHGWPGAGSDMAAVAASLSGVAEVVVPDLRGFGRSYTRPVPDAAAIGADGQARSVLGLVEELELDRPVLAGYDVGSRVAQAVGATAPERLGALVIAPPVPGVGERVLTPEAQREFWYQSFHQLTLAERLVDGRPEAVRPYLEHFWSHWSAPGWEAPGTMLAQLVAAYARPGAFTTSIAWYRAGAGTVARALDERVPARDDRLAVPTTVLWPERDPLFPRAWADRLEDFFADVELRDVSGSGHFVPLEAPEAVAAAVRDRLA